LLKREAYRWPASDTNPEGVEQHGSDTETPERVITVSKEKTPRFTVTKTDDGFDVAGDLVRKLVYQLNMESMDSLLHFHRVLEKHGVIQKLKDMGVQEGDTVRVLEVEFEFTEEFDPRD